MKEGKITKVIEDRNFFFIDGEYWCHFNQYNDTPVIGDLVEYEPEIRPDGKKNAHNVRLIMKSLENDKKMIKETAPGFFSEYINELKKGYFNEKGYLKDEFVIQYPKKLAELFTMNDKKNKHSQIRQFFEVCMRIDGVYKLRKDFDYVKSELYKLIPRAYESKQKEKTSEEFYRFIETNIEQALISEKYFTDGFIHHFQSLICYYKT